MAWPACPKSGGYIFPGKKRLRQPYTGAHGVYPPRPPHLELQRKMGEAAEAAEAAASAEAAAAAADAESDEDGEAAECCIARHLPGREGMTATVCH